MKYKTKHEQTTTEYNGNLIEVDKQMLYILEKMWSLGIETNFSCQGDAYFVDQTEYAGKQHRAYIQMVRDERSLWFVQQLLEYFYAFTADKVSWDISFDRSPLDDENRISIRFPNFDIEMLDQFLGFLIEDSMQTVINTPECSE